MKLNIIKIYEEIVSGEFIDFRPEMLSLLKSVQNGEYDAVLVMDVDRFGRGNMQEQGLILDSFRKSKTKIITPRKTYDLTDEFDEEYSEFEAFMARKELKIITRRMQGGRVRSVEEGNYIGTRPPYGYSVQDHERGGRYLVPITEQSDVVKMIFEWYTNEQMGSSKISRELNKLGFLSYTGKHWEPSSVLGVIKNAVYIGRIQWKKKDQKKSLTPGKRRDSKARAVEEWIDVKGKHEPIIEESVFKRAQEILKTKYHIPFQLVNGIPKITTSLAGLIKCGNCGSTMVYRPYANSPAHIRCNNQQCDNKSSRYEFVESKLIQSLRIWLSDFKVEWNAEVDSEPNKSILFKRNSIFGLKKELDELDLQKGKLFDFLERGIYSEETFIERSQNIAERINAVNQTLDEIDSQLDLETKRLDAKNEIIPRVEQVINIYEMEKEPVNKNIILKSIIHHVDYKKEKSQRNDEFTLILHLIF
jgi:site-specific DNA recombinase